MPKVNECTNKIALGTVQFGLDYGISNSGGKTSESEVCEILTECRNAGIHVFDTASAYGDSEAVLGKCLQESTTEQIVTKLPAGIAASPGKVADFFADSLKRLNREKIYGLLLHSEEDLTGPQSDALWNQLINLKNSGQVKKIGASFYSPEKLLSSLNRYDLSLVQVPYNLLDHRFFTQELSDAYERKSVEVHTRSVFLQGALFLDLEKTPAALTPFSSTLKRIFEIGQHYGQSAHLMSLSDALFNSHISKVVLGFSKAAELREILSSKVAEITKEMKEELGEVKKTMDAKLIDPRLWKKNG